jgi:opacity protein-like surface antigen
MKNTKVAVAILGLLAAALVGPAAAQDKGIYLGASGGYSLSKDACKNLAIPCGSVDPAWRLFGGYRFSRAVSAELGYADFGEVEGEGSVAAGPARLVRRTSAVDLVGVFSVPIVDRLSVFGKFGMYRGRTKLDVTIAGAPEHAGGTNAGWTYGAGLGYDLGRIGVRAEWQRYDNVGSHSTGEDDIDALTLGLIWRF